MAVRVVLVETEDVGGSVLSEVVVVALDSVVEVDVSNKSAIVTVVGGLALGVVTVVVEVDVAETVVVVVDAVVDMLAVVIVAVVAVVREASSSSLSCLPYSPLNGLSRITLKDFDLGGW